MIADLRGEPTKKAPRSGRFARPAWWWIGIALALGLLAYFNVWRGNVYAAKSYYMPSESMLPTLFVGDRFIVGEILTPQMIEQGDVVTIGVIGVNGGQETYVKRVIGMPGDKIQVQNGVVILNGVRVKRSATMLRTYPRDKAQQCNDPAYAAFQTKGSVSGTPCVLPVARETLPNNRSFDIVDLGYFPSVDDYPATTIPSGHVFLMGDNRDNSADSRVSMNLGGLGGSVPLTKILGRAEIVSYSLDGSESWWNPLTWNRALRGGRAGTSLHPSKTG